MNNHHLQKQYQNSMPKKKNYNNNNKMKKKNLINIPLIQSVLSLTNYKKRLIKSSLYF